MFGPPEDCLLKKPFKMYSRISELKLLLDTTREDGYDFRFLADKLGLPMEMINHLGGATTKAGKSPTEVLFNENEVALDKLRNIFNGIRDDVVKKIDDFMRDIKRDCNCADCASLN